MNYISALLGSVLFILIRLKIEKQKKDSKPRYKFKFRNYFNKEWDDWGMSIVVGFIITVFQEQIYFGYVEYYELDFDKMSDLYYEIDNLISGSIGLFGSLFIMIVFKYIVRKAEKFAG